MNALNLNPLWTLQTYKSDVDNVTHLKQWLINPTAVLSILSTAGNGGTHLLMGLLKEAQIFGTKLIIYKAEDIASKFNKIGKSADLFAFEKLILSNEAIIIDDFQLLINHQSFIRWFQPLLNQFVSSGKKFIFTFTELREEHLHLPLFIQELKPTTIYSLLPANNILIDIANSLFESEKITLKFDKTLYFGCSSVNELQAYCIYRMYIEVSRSKTKMLTEQQIYESWNQRIKAS